MYRLSQNPNLLTQKRWRQAAMTIENGDKTEVFYCRPPLLVDLFYLVMVHSKFRSDAERLLGWLMLRLYDASHLVYRPRKFKLPDGREVDSLGRAYDLDASREDDLMMEKVSLALLDDLTIGDATNLLSLHEAPYRPYLTYRARVALDGPVAASEGGSKINMGRLADSTPDMSGEESPSGRIRSGKKSSRRMNLPGPTPHNVRRPSDAETDSEA